MSSGLRSGQVAEAAGVNQQTLRYYERRGLLAEPDRTLGGHRLYPPETVTTLRVIKTAQRLGFTLDEVAELLSVSVHRHGRRPEAGLPARAQAKLVEVEQKIADLTVIRDTLRVAVAAGGRARRRRRLGRRHPDDAGRRGRPGRRGGCRMAVGGSAGAPAPPRVQRWGLCLRRTGRTAGTGGDPGGAHDCPDAPITTYARASAPLCRQDPT
ncbi:MerR family transcriptional regulator [Micromonospora radicis]|uniref:MerR family transcriptional regulator n=1 Tax=Micromonospora radicis TaxID=1894971 RepID=A0A418MZ38_9ACTN|nr:MerR family transcriptional regulator [Micromonospora radicis]RIV40357.1 MerR family transcriptional regulator [Micromonospora radicis]